MNCENKLFGLDGEEKKYSERFFTIKDNIKFRNKNMVPRRIFFSDLGEKSMAPPFKLNGRSLTTGNED
jgi:hypothetical protein